MKPVELESLTVTDVRAIVEALLRTSRQNLMMADDVGDIQQANRLRVEAYEMVGVIARLGRMDFDTALAYVESRR